jgi:enoyl reductase-like protein
VNQMIRIIRVYSIAAKTTLNKYNILDLLVRSVDQRLQELEEGDVLTLLKTFETLDKQVSYSDTLFKNLTETVSQQAIEN